jgi:alpha-tubulin suppressor-like RCC1 family protein
LATLTLLLGIPLASCGGAAAGAPHSGGDGGASDAVNANPDAGLPLDALAPAWAPQNLAAGAAHTCALTRSGGVKCWGRGDYGQLGNGGNMDSHVPVDVVGLSSGVVAISAGGFASCALTSAGAVKCWGTLDDPSCVPGEPRNVPGDVAGLGSGVVAVAVGQLHACVLLTDGRVECWGCGSEVQAGSASFSSAPTQVAGLSGGSTAVAAGDGYSCARTSTGGVSCWGANRLGEVGNGTTTDSPLPVGVTGLADGVASLAKLGGAQTCVVLDGRGVKCWGDNSNGQLGNDSSAILSPVPVDVVGLAAGVEAVAVGQQQTVCALLQSGAVKCWGDNGYGQLGDGTLNDSSVPVDVVGLGPGSGAVAVTVGDGHSCVYMGSGAIKCWGSNSYAGQLGNGTMSDSPVPVDVAGFP